MELVTFGSLATDFKSGRITEKQFVEASKEDNSAIGPP